MTHHETIGSQIQPVPDKTSDEVVGVRQELRRATRLAHDRLDRVLRLTSGDLTRDAYAESLVRFHAIYTALEQRLSTYDVDLASAHLDWPARRKVPLLERDLVALGATNLSTTRLPIPRLDTFSSALGCLYVLEGATLGGRIISRNLEECLHLGPHNGASFFNSYGAGLAEMWGAFCSVLERELCDASLRSEAVLAAISTFDFFYAHLTEGEITCRPQ